MRTPTFADFETILELLRWAQGWEAGQAGVSSFLKRADLEDAEGAFKDLLNALDPDKRDRYQDYCPTQLVEIVRGAEKCLKDHVMRDVHIALPPNPPKVVLGPEYPESKKNKG